MAFPVCQLVCRVRLENQLNGETQTVNVSGGIWPKGTRTMKIALQSPWCGRIRLTVESARLFDCFGLIGVKTRPDAHGACVVQPDTFLQTLGLSPAAAHIDDTEDYSNERPGYDLSEMFQIRDYVPGDSPKQVHWKLSPKIWQADRQRPVAADHALCRGILGAHGRKPPTAARTDAEAGDCRLRLPESAFPVRPIHGRLERGRSTGRCVFQQIRDMDDLIGLMPRLLTAQAATGVSGASLLLQEGTCRKLVASDLRFR